MILNNTFWKLLCKLQCGFLSLYFASLLILREREKVSRSLASLAESLCTFLETNKCGLGEKKVSFHPLCMHRCSPGNPLSRVAWAKVHTVFSVSAKKQKNRNNPNFQIDEKLNKSWPKVMAQIIYKDAVDWPQSLEAQEILLGKAKLLFYSRYSRTLVFGKIWVLISSVGTLRAVNWSYLWRRLLLLSWHTPAFINYG